RPHRADRVAAILDYHLGRAPERRNQLPHRVHRGAEQPASGRLHHAQAYSRCCGGRRTGRRRLRLLFPAQPGLPIWLFSPARLGLPTQLGPPDWSPAQLGLSNWFPAQLGPRLTIWIADAPGSAAFVIAGYRATTTPSAFLPMRSIAFCAKPEAFMSATKALAYSATAAGEPFGYPMAIGTS